MVNCPICGRHIGEFQDDPILNNPSLSTDEFKGFTQLIATHIIQLQTERHQQEIDNAVIPLTDFSPVNNSGLFQNIKQYILELRNSTEKILSVTGQTLTDFLSTDEDGNPMSPKSDWTDSNLDSPQYQCKAIHIEDLRHFMQFAGWRETWEHADLGLYTNMDVIISGNFFNYYIPKLKGDTINGNFGKWWLGFPYDGEFISDVNGGLYRLINKIEIKNVSNNKLLSLNQKTQYISGSGEGFFIFGNYAIPYGVTTSSPPYQTQSINQPLKSTTKLSFDITNFFFTLSNLSGDYLSFAKATIILRFIQDGNPATSFIYNIDAALPNGDYTIPHLISYIGTLSMPLTKTGIVISHNEFQSFNRNLYDDYVAILGTPPIGTYVDNIEIFLWTQAQNGIGNSQIGFNIDNLKIRG